MPVKKTKKRQPAALTTARSLAKTSKSIVDANLRASVVSCLLHHRGGQNIEQVLVDAVRLCEFIDTGKVPTKHLNVIVPAQPLGAGLTGASLPDRGTVISMLPHNGPGPAA